MIGAEARSDADGHPGSLGRSALHRTGARSGRGEPEGGAGPGQGGRAHGGPAGGATDRLLPRHGGRPRRAARGNGAADPAACPRLAHEPLTAAAQAVSRCAPAYTFIVGPRRKPTRVRPASAARSAASEDGAETAASTGMPARTAFCTSSNEARPLTSSTHPRSGSLSCRSAQPMTLSTALCLPTSSRTASSSPEGPNTPAACSPPVLANTRCAARSASGADVSQPAPTRTGSSLMSQVCSTNSCAVLAFPHTPHALVVMKFLRAAGVTASPARSSTSTMLPNPS